MKASDLSLNLESKLYEHLLRNLAAMGAASKKAKRWQKMNSDQCKNDGVLLSEILQPIHTVNPWLIAKKNILLELILFLSCRQVPVDIMYNAEKGRLSCERGVIVTNVG